MASTDAEPAAITSASAMTDGISPRLFAPRPNGDSVAIHVLSTSSVPVMRTRSLGPVIDSDQLEAGRGWSQASLRIASEDLDADAICDLLGRRASSTRESEGDPTFTVWVLESGLDPSAPIEDHLYILMEVL